MRMTKTEQKAMSNRIKERRKFLNYTQEQFAEIIGISASSYTRIENAFQNPSLDTLIKISLNLKIPLDYIVFGEPSGHMVAVSDIDKLAALIDFSDKDKLKHASDVLGKIVKIKENL